MRISSSQQDGLVVSSSERLRGGSRMWPSKAPGAKSYFSGSHNKSGLAASGMLAKITAPRGGVQGTGFVYFTTSDKTQAQTWS